MSKSQFEHRLSIIPISNGGRNTLIIKLPPEMVRNYECISTAAGINAKRPFFTLQLLNKKRINTLKILERNGSRGYINMSWIKNFVPASAYSFGNMWTGVHHGKGKWTYILDNP